MKKAKKGDKVSVHYTGTLEDGSVFDSSTERGPLEFTIGDGNIMPAFEEAVMGLTVGESVTTEVVAEKAYGPYRNEMIADIDRSNFPEDVNPKVGDKLEAKDPKGAVTIVVVKDISDESVTIDANHPLAGKDLKFDIELVEVATA